MNLATELRTVPWPKGDGQFKFVQVEVGGQVIRHFGQKPHAALLAEALTYFGIGYATTIGRKSGVQIPAPSGPGYILRGAGLATVNGNNINSFGQSEDYNIGPDNYDLANVVRERAGRGITDMGIGLD